MMAAHFTLASILFVQLVLQSSSFRVGLYRFSDWYKKPVRNKLGRHSSVVTCASLASGAYGSITLVGAGPGDPDLLTVAAAKILQKEDCLVIADRLVSPEILATVRGELKIARKLPGCADKAQKEIDEWVKESVMRGVDVVRLKIGDPFVFGRGAEEILEYRETLGIEAQVVPGVSAVFASPLVANIPITHRGVANQVIMSTGFGGNYSVPDLQQYHPSQTAVFLMAVGKLEGLCARLVSEAGYPPHLPVAIVERATCRDQRTLIGTVDTIGALAKTHQIRPPSTIIFGEVVRVLHGDSDGLIQDGTQEERDDNNNHHQIEQLLQLAHNHNNDNNDNDAPITITTTSTTGQQMTPSNKLDALREHEQLNQKANKLAQTVKPKKI